MPEFDNVGCLVTRDGMLYQVCSSEESAEICASTYRKAQIVEINERTRLAYLNFVALRDNHNVSKVA